jgi:hypothetical protein
VAAPLGYQVADTITLILETDALSVNCCYNARAKLNVPVRVSFAGHVGTAILDAQFFVSQKLHPFTSVPDPIFRSFFDW